MWREPLATAALVVAMLVQTGCTAPPEERRGPVPEEKLLPGPKEAPRERREIIEEWKLEILPGPDLAAAQPEDRFCLEGACTLAAGLSTSGSGLPPRK